MSAHHADPPNRPQTRPRFWERGLNNLTPQEWEALCDGCGKCCLNKLEDDTTGEVVLTRIACRLLDIATCRCTDYRARTVRVPECVVLSPASLPQVAYFMPQTCAYRRLYEGKGLPVWHPLLTGDPQSVQHAGVSVRGWALSESEIAVHTWEDHVVEEPLGPGPVDAPGAGAPAAGRQRKGARKRAAKGAGCARTARGARGRRRRDTP